jgi:PTH1 family peptidyl-tRNA hydrolase
MKLIVGLGNPGRPYVGTRHNVGFVVVEQLARRGGAASWLARFQGELAEVQLGAQRLLLLRPLTYMNRSGLSVVAAHDFYKLDVADMLIICDDLNLPLGRLRCRARGSSGGQKGLQDILQRLGTDDVPRLRIGIGTPPAGWDSVDFVLSRFRPEDGEVIDAAVHRAADAAIDWVQHGIAFCMNRYNGEEVQERS